MKRKLTTVLLSVLLMTGAVSPVAASEDLEIKGYIKAEKALEAAKSSNYDLAHRLWMEERDIWKQLDWIKNPMFEQYYISAERKATHIRNESRVFVERHSETVGNKYYHNAKFEPRTGAYLGMFGEGDPGIHDIWGTGTRETYVTGSQRITGRKYANFLLYYHWGMDFSHYQTHFDRMDKSNTSVMIALEPTYGLDVVEDCEYLRKFIRDMGEAGMPMFLRFANEMNDPWNPWHAYGPEKYKEKFKLVSKILKEEAPNVALVWSPNDYPPTQVDVYYPGDQYVDWVGVSTYSLYSPYLDPLKQGIDRTCYIDNMKYIYDTYGKRKPIMITEGAASAVDLTSHFDTSSFASQQIKEFYSYLPRLYPNVKGAVYWNSKQDDRHTNGNYRNFILTSNPKLLESYRSSIHTPYYLSNIGESSSVVYEDAADTLLKAGMERVSAFVKTHRPGISRVDYVVDGETLATSSSVPFEVDIDFSRYAGRSIDIIVNAYDIHGTLMSSKPIKTWVSNQLRTPSNDNPFTDMREDDWFIKSVEYVYKKRLFNGVAKDKFEPSTHMNRAMLVQTLYNLEGKPSVRWSNKFNDVERGQWYSDAVIWAEEMGIVSGYGDNLFGVSDKVTREQIALMLYRFTEAGDTPNYSSLNKYVDKDKISSWAVDAVAWANTNKIINGRTETSLSPRGNATRAEVATILMNLTK